MTRVAVLSANLGGYDVPQPWPDLIAPEGVSVCVHRFDDSNFPPRPLAMTSRLQCGIPKWHGSEMCPEADVLIWVDASCVPAPTLVSWFLERLDTEIAVLKHPERATIRDEYAFVKARMARPGETYLNSRYRGEWLDQQFSVIDGKGLAGLPLYASTSFAYRPTTRVVAALRECFLLKARYLLHDQLAFPYVLHTHGCQVTVLPDNYLKCEALSFARASKRKAS